MKKILFFLTMTLFLTKVLNAQPILIFAQIAETPDQMIGAEILKVAYGKIGISIKMVDMPGKRALTQSSQGKVDGEVHRIIEVEDAYPTLIRVPTPINYIEPSVFAKHYNFKITNCAALKKYNVGIVRGVKHAELCTKGMNNVHTFNFSTKMMELLDAKRIDIAITARINGLLLSKKMGMESIQPLSPPLSKKMVYHYVHEKHKSLVSKINKVFIEMKKSGELEMLRKKAIKTLLKNAESK